MRKLLICLFALSAMFTPGMAKEQHVVLDVATMFCGPDPHNIKSALSALSGVSEVRISLEQKTATVTYDDQKSTVDQLLSAMAGAGYATLVKKP
jgi:periplasmic mercuric ion binding protein